MDAGPKSKALMSGIGLEELNELAKPPEPQQPEAEVRLPVLLIHYYGDTALYICTYDGLHEYII